MSEHLMLLVTTAVAAVGNGAADGAGMTYDGMTDARGQHCMKLQLQHAVEAPGMNYSGMRCGCGCVPS